jgi:hypothetical protein
MGQNQVDIIHAIYKSRIWKLIDIDQHYTHTILSDLGRKGSRLFVYATASIGNNSWLEVIGGNILKNASKMFHGLLSEMDAAAGGSAKLYRRRRKMPAPVAASTTDQPSPNTANWYYEVRSDSQEVLDDHIYYCNMVLSRKRLVANSVYCVCYLILHALPVMEHEHRELYDQIVEVSKQLMQRYPDEFKRAYVANMEFLMPENRELTPDNYFVPSLDAATNPLFFLDVCETLLKMGDRSPFNSFPFDMDRLLRVRGMFLEMGPERMRMDWRLCSDVKKPLMELERYVKRHYK